MRRGSTSRLLLALLVAAGMARTPEAQGASEPGAARAVVRVPPNAMARVESLGIEPRRALDYGSFVWLEVSAADLKDLQVAKVPFQAVEGAGRISVPGYDFDPVQGGPPNVPGLASGPQAGLRLIQFHGPVRDEWIAELGAQRIKLLQYYPHNAYLVWTTAAQAAAAQQLSFVRWQGPFQPAYKLEPGLAGRSGRIDNVDVMFYNDGQVERTLDAIRQLGGRVLRHHASQPDEAFFDVIVRIEAGALADIARIPTVLWMGYESPRPRLDDEMSDQIQAGNHPGGSPVAGYNAFLSTLGYNGNGVTWAIVDTGVDYDHPELAPRIAGGYEFPGSCNKPGQPGSDCTGGGHGTHVAGIVAGTGSTSFTDASGFLYGLGVAPGTGLFAMNSLSAPAWPPAGGWQEHTKRALLGGAVGGNNSWTTGEGTAHGYQASERTHDLMVRDGNFDTAALAEPFIEVFSAGNSGPGVSTLTAPHEAKNVIAIASSRNFRAGSIDTLSSFSSRGPAVDGRIVPVLAAPGEQIASARNDEGGSCATAITGTNNLHAFCSGTSMASPHASGAAALVTQWWKDTHAGAVPSPAMVKTVLVNSAVDMGTADIPNFNEGWGRIDVNAAIRPVVPRVMQDQARAFAATGDVETLNVTVADPSKPLKVTVAWTDAPGAVGATPALVNNLDLAVHTNGITYRGNRFAGGWSTTGTAVDTINNTENVYVQSPGTTAVITILATAVNGDGVPYNADTTDQDYALVCQNCVLVAGPVLSVTRIGSGAEQCGVTSSPAGINCGPTCGAPFGPGASVQLTASGLFTGWGGACSGTSPTCDVAVNGATAVTARCELPPQTLTVTKNGSGQGTVTSSPTGINCGGTCTAAFPGGTPVTLTASAALGSTFVGWGGACSGTSSTTTVTADAAKTCQATFDTCGAATPIAGGQTLAGSLQSTDCFSATRAGRYADRFSFSATAGDQVVITQTGSFDTWLNLFRPDSTLLASDDDAGPGTDSRIPTGGGLLTLPATGTYVIEATSFSAGATGTYSVTLEHQRVVGPRPVDFNGDGKSDLIVRNDTSGQSFMWMMNGGTLASFAEVTPSADPSWRFVRSGDYDGDGKWDLVVSNAATGQSFMWLMNGGTLASFAEVTPSADPNWTFVTTGDYDGDGKWDLVVSNAATGQSFMWMMNGGSLASFAEVTPSPDPNWKFILSGDFNGDGRHDLVVRNQATGQTYMWMMNGGSIASFAEITPSADTNWRHVTSGDHDGDGRWDLVVRNQATGQTYMWMMNGGTLTSFADITPSSDPAWRHVATADYNGDGKADLVVSNVSTGASYMWFMNGGTLTGFAEVTPSANPAWKFLSLP